MKHNNQELKTSSRFKNMSMQSILMLTFSVLSVLIILITGVLLYQRFSAISRQKEVASTQEMIGQTKEAMDDYLMRMRQISDTAYYNVVKENDFSNQMQTIHSGMNILYEGNKDDLASIAIYNNFGSLVLAEPVASQKEDPDVTNQEWYQQALSEMENIHFSTPHIQNLFDNGTMRYEWVISLARAVELNNSGESQLGVLLVDMDYYKISHMLEQLNSQSSKKYYYLCDSTGNIIYHPKQVQISKKIVPENNSAIVHYQEGVHDEYFQGAARKVLVSDISYTGWKLVGVIPAATFTQDTFQTGLFIALYVVLMAMVLVVINRMISLRISRPLQKLNASVMEYEAGAGAKPAIYLGGSTEIRHLGQSIQQSYEQIDQLMKEIILEHNERRKSELDVLQSQINPHFLYNTLESITWMIEGEENDRAVFMITQLAKLFRISLSKGRTIIPVADELQHAKSYMNIQKQRYKEAIAVTFEVEPALNQLCIVKLVLQPILENSLNYALKGLDDSGEIKVVGRLVAGDIVLTVTDNGIGIAPDEIDLLLTDRPEAHKKGSGVGLVNVHKRIQLFFGKEYGVTITSKLDEGTTVTIKIPAIPYTEENRQILEQGYNFGGEAMIEEQSQEAAHEK
ncbi:cache domain-containing sensor histidine kinase [Enterococcus nangangensis]|uniref:cache domain-containing sensor histidine kinase n=1 Tax=Enterococcus nangangensis TaxID=2559926 RepID=UPI001BB15875|nr:sensor histidine kinase [Enterococcus nangangensis]